MHGEGLTPDQNSEAQNLYRSAEKDDSFEKTNDRLETLANELGKELTPQQRERYHSVIGFVLYTLDDDKRKYSEFRKEKTAQAIGHFRQHEEGYKEQAVKEATAAGHEIHYPPYTSDKGVSYAVKHGSTTEIHNVEPDPKRDALLRASGDPDLDRILPSMHGRSSNPDSPSEDSPDQTPPPPMPPIENAPYSLPDTAD